MSMARKNKICLNKGAKKDCPFNSNKGGWIVVKLPSHLFFSSILSHNNSKTMRTTTKKMCNSSTFNKTNAKSIENIFADLKRLHEMRIHTFFRVVRVSHTPLNIAYSLITIRSNIGFPLLFSLLILIDYIIIHWIELNWIRQWMGRNV